MKIAVIIPVFNHAGTIEQVIADVRAVLTDAGEEAELIVVDDGCTDGSTQVLKRITGITLLTHARNMGKGHALDTGFRHANQNGCTHVVTVDADGQHCPTDIVHLLAAGREHPHDLIIGHRDMDAATGGGGGGNVPQRSKKGRDAATFWLRVQTGQHIPDSQCGLRCYPLAHTLALRCRFWRFDFETEILARLAWGGVRIRSVPIECIYFPAAKRVSHFRPVMDTLRGVRVNVFLVFRRLIPIPFKRLVKPPKGEGGEGAFGKWWQARAWRNAIHEALRAGSSNAELATAFAVGIFLGLTPLYFLQTILAIYFARRLHLNVLAAVIGSQISIPPLLPIWLVLSYGMGTLLLHGRWIAASVGTLSREMLPAFLVGNFIVALGVALIGLAVARSVLSVVRPTRVPA